VTAAGPVPSGPQPGPGRAARRLALAGGVTLVLLAVAAVAAGGDRADDSGGITLPPVRWLVSVVFVVLLVIGLGVFVALLLQPRERRPRSGTRQLRVLLIATAIVMVLLLLAGRRQNDSTPLDQTADATDQRTPDPRAGDLQSDTVARDVALLLGLIVIGSAAAVVAAGRRYADLAGEADDERSEAAALSDVLDEAVGALRREPDPRRAVIAAYAHVERSLRFHRLPRRPSETALEYLGRLLEHLDASGPAIRRLTGLFERAMFSTHHIDRAMQDEAVDALVAVRDELRSLAAGPDGAAP
jgi:Domain of unknown function (DUF4129)